MDDIEKTMRALGLPVRGPADAKQPESPSDHDVYLLRAVPDARETRIIDRSLNWIAFLEEQAQKLTDVASRLYDRLAAVFRPLGSAQAGTDSRSDTIERLEWTLAALGWWLEEQKPAHRDARFCVQWTVDDGLAHWVSAEAQGEPASLRAVVVGAAEIEGGFSAQLSAPIAAAVVAGLRSGDVSLLRVRRVQDDPSRAESVFELIPRDKVYGDVSIPMTAEAVPMVPVEAEAPIADLQMAALIDHASYAAAGVGPGGESTVLSLETDLVENVAHIANRCHLPKKTVAECLLALVNEQLEAADRASDHQVVLRLGRAVRSLATFLLSE